jgi:hypothetical protein
MPQNPKNKTLSTNINGKNKVNTDKIGNSFGAKKGKT